MVKIKILEYLQHDINDLKGIITCGENETQEKDVIKAQARALRRINEVNLKEDNDLQLAKDFIELSILISPPQVKEGIPFLVISNVREGIINISNATRFVPNNYFDLIADSRKPNKGNILYTVTGSIGIPVMVNTEEKFCFQRHIGIIKPNSNINNEYLLNFLKSSFAYKQGESIATGTAQLTIPLRGLRNYLIPIPPVEEQQEIVKRVKALFEKADKIEESYKKAKFFTDKLTQSILNKAFKGELVPQDPTDEPASTLLKTIKENKAR